MRKDKLLAANGTDPAAPATVEIENFAGLIDSFIELHAKPNQRSWKETERMLRYCCQPWLNRPVQSIGTADAQRLIDEYMRADKRATAQLLLRWLRALWKWAGAESWSRQGHDAGRGVHLQEAARTDVFSDADLAAIWKATEGLTRTEAAAVKLLLLLAPRRTALSHMRWQDLDNAENPTLWVTPPEFTKTMATAAPRVYKTPLPEAAVAILKSLPQMSPYVFPSVEGSGPLTFGSPLKRKLVRHGAPANLRFHTARHTLASFFLRRRGTWKSGCC